jgi:hypothetical protein
MFKLNNKKLTKIVGQVYMDVLKEDQPLLKKNSGDAMQSVIVKKKAVKKISTNNK